MCARRWIAAARRRGEDSSHTAITRDLRDFSGECPRATVSVHSTRAPLSVLFQAVSREQLVHLHRMRRRFPWERSRGGRRRSERKACASRGARQYGIGHLGLARNTAETSAGRRLVEASTTRVDRGTQFAHSTRRRRQRADRMDGAPRRGTRDHAETRTFDEGSIRRRNRRTLEPADTKSFAPAGGIRASREPSRREARGRRGARACGARTTHRPTLRG